jgi:hypothetical protein
VGTIGYMAPEQIRGEPFDGRVDLYSLGCVLFECLTGHAPFERDSQPAMMFAHVNDERPRPSALRPDLGERFDAVTGRAMALEPDDRYATGAELGDAVAAARRGEAPAGVTAPTPRPAAPMTRTAVTDQLHDRSPASAGATPAPAGAVAGTAGRRVRPLMWLAAALAVGVVTAAAYAAAGGFSGGGGSTPAGSPGADATTTQGDTTTAGEDPADQREVRAVLKRYERAYTNHDVGALAALFAPDVTRKGLRAGGCSETSGINHVLDTYSEQFDAGTGAYALTDLSPDAIDISGDTASADSAYTITPGGSGRVSFELRREGPEWLITRIDASC